MQRNIRQTKKTHQIPKKQNENQANKRLPFVHMRKNYQYQDEKLHKNVHKLNVQKLSVEESRRQY